MSTHKPSAHAAPNGADGRLEAAIDMLARLIGFDTESSKSNLALVASVEDYLKSIGVDYVKVPNATGDKAALFLTIGPKIDGGVVLSGHTDVVPVEGQNWTSDPFSLRREGGRLFGRGACDMKGFDSICLAMIPEFQKAKLSRPDPYSFELRRRDDVPRSARYDRALRRRSAAPGRGSRRRADADAGGGRA